MPSWGRASAVGILIVLVAAGFASASPSLFKNAAPTVSASENPTSFVYAGIGEPFSLDPAIDYETAGGEVLQNVYETLVWYDGPRADVFVPVLATEVPTVENGLVSSDGLAYTLHVRPGVVFHDGTPLTADDVVYSIQRVLRIHSPGGPSWMLEQVLTDYVSYFLGYTVAEYLAASNNAPWIAAVLDPLGPDHIITEADVQAVSEVSVVKPDEMTVMFRLTHAYPAFVSVLAFTTCSIVSKDYVEAHGGVVNGEQNAWIDVHTCGTGPYELVTWEFGSSISLKRFDGYHGTLPSLVDVTILKANDVNTRLLMLEDGTADSISLPIRYEYWVSGNPDVTVIKGYPTFNLDFAAFNFHIDSARLNSQFGGTITDDFFTDLHMRKAFAHLVDYANLMLQCNGNAIQANGPIPMGMLGYDPTVPVYTYDLAAARAELELAINPSTGNSWWVDGFALPLFFNAGNTYRQAFCGGLKAALESLGTQFSALINALDWPTYLDWAFRNPSVMPMQVGGWAPDYADPDDYATPLLDSVYGNYRIFSGYANPAVDALVREAAAELDPDVRASLYSQLSWLAYDDVPYLWLTQALSFRVMRSWVVGYYYNPMYSNLYYPALSKVAPAGIELVKKAGGPMNSAVSWDYVPAHYGNWTGRIVNNGLRSLVVNVYDNTTGVPDEVMHQKINFRTEDAYPEGTIYTQAVSMSPGHKYLVTVIPNGPRDSRAVMTNTFEIVKPPVASFTWFADWLIVFVDGTSSYDLDGTVVACEWDWGDGSTEEGWWTTYHTYESAGTYPVSLTVTDDSGLSDTTSVQVSVIQRPAELSPPHSDYGLDTDGDGLYDYLVVEASVEVREASYYSAYATLQDSSWNMIASTSSQTLLDIGQQKIMLLFQGYLIYNSGLDGPYNVEIALYVMDSSLGSDRHTTSTYAWGQFQVSPAKLTPPHADYGLDSDGNGKYDYLALELSVEVSVAGNYTFGGYLYDSSSNFVTSSSSYTYLSAGLQSVQVLFRGWAIMRSGLDGPYVATIDLADQAGNLLDSGTHTTQAYTSSQFQLPPAELAPPHSDYGLDTDGDGLYDYLAIELSVSILVEDFYRFNAYLCDSSSNFINSVSIYIRLEPGLQTVQILFAGYMIYNTGLDGPYRVSLELMDHMGYPLDSGTHTTQAYSWIQFQPPAAEFAPPHSDHGLDTDGDGLYDYLVIDVSVSVSVAGSYSLGGGLYDNPWNCTYVGPFYNSTYLESGLQTVQVFIAGYMIHDSGFNGPYYASISLGDSVGNWLQSGTYFTQAYTWDQFEPPPARLAPPHSDFGLDSDGDGLYDNLVVEVSVSVLEAGDYTFSAQLMDGLMTWIAWIGISVYLESGIQTVKISYQDHQIRDSGLDGPYIVALGLSDTKGNWLGSDTYVTQAYSWSQFSPAP